MKMAVRAVQIFVAVLFIASGLIKANDPIGLAYKMEEFFELWSAGFAKTSFIATVLTALHKVALPLSIGIITVEILAGVALLLGWKKKALLWLLLTLIIFFTLLTGYAYLSGKFTNCGCFGDCLPITPLTSFIKDLVLLAMIVFLLTGQKYIVSLFSSRKAVGLLAVAAFLSIGATMVRFNYLPLADCLPFKKGNNISEQMKPPPGALQDSFAIRFVYEKAGKQYEFAPENLPPDFTTYKFIDRKQSLVRKGNADAPIKGFSLVGASGEDSTLVILSEPAAVLVYLLDFKKTGWLDEFRKLCVAANAKNAAVYVASPSITDAQTFFAGSEIPNLQFFDSDFTVVRTVARTTPTILFLKSGGIVKKWSKKQMANATEYVSSQTF